MMQKTLYTLIFFGTFAAYVFASFILGTLSAPPEIGDGQDYDAIAFNLWHHQGFGTDWDNPEWRQPYLGSPVFKDVLDRHSDFQLTTYRPPAMPYLLAFVYSVAGRNFAAWRIVNCAIMAGAVALAAAIAARFGGEWAAIIATIFALLHPQLIASSQRFLTEALAAFFVTLLAWTWLSDVARGRTSEKAAKLGIVLALLVATRSIFILWAPIALLVPNGEDSSGTKWPWRPKAVCLGAFLLVIGPWWIRNILVTGDFMPFGTEGAINLPAAFGPRALAAQGVWAPNDGDGAPELSAQNLDPLTFEVRLAKYRSALTIRWMSQHPLDVLRLMFLHVWQELRPQGRFYPDLLLVAGGMAAFLLRKSSGVRIMVLFVVANIFGIALTWSVAGRFMTPVQPLLIALAGAMAARIAHRAVNLLRHMELPCA